MNETVRGQNTATAAGMEPSRLRITLMQETGIMRSIILPEKMEGRYAFDEEDLPVQALPLWFEPQGGRWYAFLDSGSEDNWVFRSANRVMTPLQQTPFSIDTVKFPSKNACLEKGRSQTSDQVFP